MKNTTTILLIIGLFVFMYFHYNLLVKTKQKDQQIDQLHYEIQQLKQQNQHQLDSLLHIIERDRDMMMILNNQVAEIHGRSYQSFY